MIFGEKYISPRVHLFIVIYIMNLFDKPYISEFHGKVKALSMIHEFCQVFRKTFFSIFEHNKVDLTPPPPPLPYT